ncbi:MAG TPA: CdaR family protein [Savagea sp.]
MDKFMDSPWFLRLTALVLALILFFSVQAEQEKKMRSASGETIDVIRDVPVEVFYDQQNLVVTGVPETIDVEIEGPQNIVQSTRLSKDFTALVDLTNLPLGEHYVMIQYENISDKLSVRSDPSRIKVKIEEMITATFSVEAELNEQSIGEEHYVSTIDVNPKQVQVTGAKSIIESIEYVKVSIDVEKGVTKSFEQKARVRVLDKDLNKLDVSIDPQEVSVQVEIEQFSKSLPLKMTQVGEAIPGVTIRSMTLDATSATVFGSKKDLERLNELFVEVDLSKVKNSGALKMPIRLPEGASRVEPETVQVNVQVDVDETIMEPETNEEVEVEAEVESNVELEKEQEISKKLSQLPVQIEGLDEHYEANIISPSTATLTITGKKSKLERLNNSNFKLYVDASSIHKVGQSRLPVQVQGPNDVKWALDVQELMITVEETHVS